MQTQTTEANEAATYNEAEAGYFRHLVSLATEAGECREVATRLATYCVRHPMSAGEARYYMESGGGQMPPAPKPLW